MKNTIHQITILIGYLLLDIGSINIAYSSYMINDMHGFFLMLFISYVFIVFTYVQINIIIE